MLITSTIIDTPTKIFIPRDAVNWGDRAGGGTIADCIDSTLLFLGCRGTLLIRVDRLQAEAWPIVGLTIVVCMYILTIMQIVFIYHSFCFFGKRRMPVWPKYSYTVYIQGYPRAPY